MLRNWKSLYTEEEVGVGVGLNKKLEQVEQVASNLKLREYAKGKAVSFLICIIIKKMKKVYKVWVGIETIVYTSAETVELAIKYVQEEYIGKEIISVLQLESNAVIL